MLLEDVGEQVRLLTGEEAVDFVERTHGRAELGLLHHDLKRQRVDLLQGALIDVRIDPHTLLLLGIHIVVFRAGHNGVALYAPNVGRRHPSREDWVFSQGLEQPTEDRHASDVQAWTQEDIVPGRFRFVANQVAVLLGSGGVPCCR